MEAADVRWLRRHIYSPWAVPEEWVAFRRRRLACALDARSLADPGAVWERLCSSMHCLWGHTGHEPHPRTKWHRTAETVVVQWMCDSAHDLALHTTEWARRRRGLVDRCNETPTHSLQLRG